MKKFLFLGYIVLQLLVTPGNWVNAQTRDTVPGSLRKDAVRFFLDCPYCDMDYIRREIPYVNYVRDVKEAQVYVLITSQMSGSGGRVYTLSFIGQKEFKNMNDTLVYSSRPDDTRDHIRAGRTQMLKMGLMRYVARTPIYSEVYISHAGELEEEKVIDRWNNWVFELESRPRFEGEEFYKELSLRNTLSVVKVTPEWKLEFDFEHRYSRTKYTFEDTLYTHDKTSKQLDNLIVKSLNDHWSTGIRVDFLSSTFNNYKLNFKIFSRIFYNLRYVLNIANIFCINTI